MENLGFYFLIASYIEQVKGGVDVLDGCGENGEEEAVVVVGDQAALPDGVEDAVGGRGLVQPGLGKPLL